MIQKFKERTLPLTQKPSLLLWVERRAAPRDTRMGFAPLTAGKLKTGGFALPTQLEVQFSPDLQVLRSGTNLADVVELQKALRHKEPRALAIRVLFHQPSQLTSI